MASIQDLLLPADDGQQLTKGPRGISPSPKPIASGETTHFTIEFILDTICPHCYVGLKNLNKAIEIYKGHHPEAIFEVTCSPLVLNPHAARSGKSAGFSPHQALRPPPEWYPPVVLATLSCLFYAKSIHTRNIPVCPRLR